MFFPGKFCDSPKELMKHLQKWGRKRVFFIGRMITKREWERFLNFHMTCDIKRQFCANTGCCLEDLLRAKANRDWWQERVKEICAIRIILWSRWWWWKEYNEYLQRHSYPTSSTSFFYNQGISIHTRTNSVIFFYTFASIELQSISMYIYEWRYSQKWEWRQFPFIRIHTQYSWHVVFLSFLQFRICDDMVEHYLLTDFSVHVTFTINWLNQNR